jgi:hypothetical protein
MRFWFHSTVLIMQALLSLTAITPFGVYNSSVTPLGLPWDAYNYCNAPHVNPTYYNVPSEPGPGAKLVYLSLVMRHHKVS